MPYFPHMDGLVQERCNSSALAMELHISYISQSIWSWESFAASIVGATEKVTLILQLYYVILHYIVYYRPPFGLC